LRVERVEMRVTQLSCFIVLKLELVSRLELVPRQQSWSTGIITTSALEAILEIGKTKFVLLLGTSVDSG